VSVDSLIQKAEGARLNARAPYSGFKVGAAVETSRGEIFTGCNVENSTYGLTVCAERVAIWKALSEGASEFKRLAIVVDTEELTPPCGACRQVIWEFCGDIEVVLSNLRDKRATYQMRNLLPHPFDRRFLRETPSQERMISESPPEGGQRVAPGKRRAARGRSVQAGRALKGRQSD
jgi:cytidine deaminase